MTKHLHDLHALFVELLKEHAEALAQINTELGDGRDEPSPDDIERLTKYRRRFNTSYSALEGFLRTIADIYEANR